MAVFVCPVVLSRFIDNHHIILSVLVNISAECQTVATDKVIILIRQVDFGSCSKVDLSKLPQVTYNVARDYALTMQFVQRICRCYSG